MVLCFIIDYVTIKTSNGLAMRTRLDDMIAAQHSQSSPATFDN